MCFIHVTRMTLRFIIDFQEHCVDQIEISSFNHRTFSYDTLMCIHVWIMFDRNWWVSHLESSSLTTNFSCDMWNAINYRSNISTDSIRNDDFLTGRYLPLLYVKENRSVSESILILFHFQSLLQSYDDRKGEQIVEILICNPDISRNSTHQIFL